MSPAPSPIVRRRRLGTELRRLRETAGLTGDQVIERVGWASASKLSRLENGRSRPALSDVQDLLEVYAVDGPERDELIAIAREAGDTRAWLRSYPVMTQRQRAYAELEAGCADISEYAPVIVPGLLQTPEYARVRIVSARPLAGDHPDDPVNPDDAETEVAARMARQSLLSRGDDPPRYVAVLEEPALTGRSGPPDVLRAQLQHLRRVAALPNVTLRLLPPSAVVADWYLPETGFSIYRFAEPEDPSAVAIEALDADVVITDEAVLDRYTQVFEWLCAAARSPEESLEWITEAVWSSGRRPAADGRGGRPPAPAQRRRRPRPDDDGI
ncbi:Helix-turn-helix domain-containing protein [Micromonospora pattaloongensis]|uniref:Helix-turn-helix domain-containing protein n=1 Tax=Micromonospora pattaloongensis TaxID=405436 RepID=A0A1H3G3V6_9ACTN|nr:helix-turn-helix transcriptional regulator [Micromonospora pattaloongensis]SDX97765.1 Helix-turn-helix domain-containing protein [Micromonospora pattaloongensis]